MANFQAQKSFIGLPLWGILLNPVAFIIFLIAIFAETNRVPFDLPEADAELVGGYHTEYGSTKFAMYFFAEYIAMMMASGLLIALFFGGFNLFPGVGRLIPLIAGFFGASATVNQNVLAGMQVASFAIKVGFMMFFFIWVRWSFPRFRFDQLMNLGWKILFPLSLANLVVVAIILYLKGG
jgi:NADH-quinone oxidoreductase subunit H